MIFVVLQSHFSTFKSLFIVRKNLPFWCVLICRPPKLTSGFIEELSDMKFLCEYNRVIILWLYYISVFCPSSSLLAVCLPRWRAHTGSCDLFLWFVCGCCDPGRFSQCCAFPGSSPLPPQPKPTTLILPCPLNFLCFMLLVKRAVPAVDMEVNIFMCSHCCNHCFDWLNYCIFCETLCNFV